jgi:thiamine kinase-like enzyme
MQSLVAEGILKIKNLMMPDIVYIDKESKLEVMIRVDGVTLKDDKQSSNYKQIIYKLAEFHEKTSGDREDMDAFLAIKDKNKSVEILDEKDLQKLSYVSEIISRKNKNTNVLYKDAHANNWMITDEGFVMVDFEYKGNAPVQYDISKLLDQYENNLSLENKHELLELYAKENKLLFDSDFIETYHYSRILLGINFALGVISKSYATYLDVENYLNNSKESIAYLKDPQLENLNLCIDKIINRFNIMN